MQVSWQAQAVSLPDCARSSQQQGPIGMTGIAVSDYDITAKTSSVDSCMVVNQIELHAYRFLGLFSWATMMRGTA